MVKNGYLEKTNEDINDDNLLDSNKKEVANSVLIMCLFS